MIDRVSSFDDAGGLFDSAQGNFDDASSAPQMDAKLLISTSDDNSTYTSFTPFQDGNYEFRFAKFKLELINDILASKEVYLGRHYMKRGKWSAAMNRFKAVIDLSLPTNNGITILGKTTMSLSGNSGKLTLMSIT